MSRVLSASAMSLTCWAISLWRRRNSWWNCAARAETRCSSSRSKARRVLGAPCLKRLHRFCDRAVRAMFAPFFDIFEPFSDAPVDD
jgi:hypothetical protein